MCNIRESFITSNSVTLQSSVDVYNDKLNKRIDKIEKQLKKRRSNYHKPGKRTRGLYRNW